MCTVVADLTDYCVADPSNEEALIMLDGSVQPNEATVPLLPCVAPEETLAFWRALGFAVTYEQTRPYLYTWRSGGAGSTCTTGARPAA
jgi:hypothetical protein